MYKITNLSCFFNKLIFVNMYLHNTIYISFLKISWECFLDNLAECRNANFKT